VIVFPKFRYYWCRSCFWCDALLLVSAFWNCLWFQYVVIMLESGWPLTWKTWRSHRSSRREMRKVRETV